MSRHSLARLYHRRAQKLHPDKGGDHDKFVKLTQAYHDLLKTKKIDDPDLFDDNFEFRK